MKDNQKMTDDELLALGQQWEKEHGQEQELALIPFGCYKYSPIVKLPDWYLGWVLQQSWVQRNVKVPAARELKRRMASFAANVEDNAIGV